MTHTSSITRPSGSRMKPTLLLAGLQRGHVAGDDLLQAGHRALAVTSSSRWSQAAALAVEVGSGLSR